MKRVSLEVIFFALIGLVPMLNAQGSSAGNPRSIVLVEVSTMQKADRLSFKVDDERIPNDDLLGFLTRNYQRYRNGAETRVLIPPSLTIQRIGAIEATINTAGFHVVRFFLYSPNSDSLVEVVFKPSVSSESIRARRVPHP